MEIHSIGRELPQGESRMEIHPLSPSRVGCVALPTCIWQVDLGHYRSQAPERARAQPRSHSSRGETLDPDSQSMLSLLPLPSSGPQFKETNLSPFSEHRGVGGKEEVWEEEEEARPQRAGMQKSL